jgi:hypothetical protein
VALSFLVEISCSFKSRIIQTWVISVTHRTLRCREIDPAPITEQAMRAPESVSELRSIEKCHASEIEGQFSGRPAHSLLTMLIITVFWNVSSCSLIIVIRHLFCPEVGENMCFRNIGKDLLDYAESHPTWLRHSRSRGHLKTHVVTVLSYVDQLK